MLGMLFVAAIVGARADTITVTNINDSGAGSLRQALVDVNDGDTIDFAVTGTIVLTSGVMTVDKTITISGPGAESLALDGNAKSGILFITPSITVSISGLTITNGNAPSYGGGVYNEAATVTLNNCIIRSNSAQYGGGIYNEAALGDATLAVNNCALTGNSVSQEGGGIYNFGFLAATVTVSASTFSGNSAFFGGGIRNVGTNVSLIVSNSTFSDNSADYGAGISNEASSGSATAAISNTTLAGNSATFFGGAIYNLRGGTADVTTSLANTILMAGPSGENIYNSGSTVTSLGYNLSSDDASGLLTGPGDQINTDPLLGPLQASGGPTLTHELLAGSPAINAGNPDFTSPPFYDQRGPDFFRVRNGRVDIGSFEVQVGSTPTPTPPPTPTPRPTPSPRPRPTPHPRPTRA